MSTMASGPSKTMEFLGEVAGVQYYHIVGARRYNGPMVETRRLLASGDRWEIRRFLGVERAEIEPLVADAMWALLGRDLEQYPSVTGYVPVDDVAALDDVDRHMVVTATTYAKPAPQVKRKTSMPNDNGLTW